MDNTGHPPDVFIDDNLIALGSDREPLSDEDLISFEEITERRSQEDDLISFEPITKEPSQQDDSKPERRQQIDSLLNTKNYWLRGSKVFGELQLDTGLENIPRFLGIGVNPFLPVPDHIGIPLGLPSPLQNPHAPISEPDGTILVFINIKVVCAALVKDGRRHQFPSEVGICIFDPMTIWEGNPDAKPGNPKYQEPRRGPGDRGANWESRTTRHHFVIEEVQSHWSHDCPGTGPTSRPFLNGFNTSILISVDDLALKINNIIDQARYRLSKNKEKRKVAVITWGSRLEFEVGSFLGLQAFQSPARPGFRHFDLQQHGLIQKSFNRARADFSQVLERLGIKFRCDEFGDLTNNGLNDAFFAFEAMLALATMSRQDQAAFIQWQGRGSPFVGMSQSFSGFNLRAMNPEGWMTRAIEDGQRRQRGPSKALNLIEHRKQVSDASPNPGPSGSSGGGLSCGGRDGLGQ